MPSQRAECGCPPGNQPGLHACHDCGAIGHGEVMKFLTRHGAGTRARGKTAGMLGTAAELAARRGAAPELAERLKARFFSA